MATDTWHATEKQQVQFSGFFRTYSLALRSNFGDGLIQQSEFRTVAGGNTTYVYKVRPEFSLLAGLDLRRDAPRNLDLKHIDDNGTFQRVTSNDLTLKFVAPFFSADGALSGYLHYDLGIRREEVRLDNVDKVNATNSFIKLAGITLAKGTLTVLPLSDTHLPIVTFSFGEGFHTNDPRIGQGMDRGTVIVPSHATQLVIRENVKQFEFKATLARVTNGQELAKIDPDTGLQRDVGPSIVKSITLSARGSFSFGFLQASWARANAQDRMTGDPIPEAPRLIWDVVGGSDRLPWGIRARAEYEAVGKKPLGDGFTAVPVREFRGALLRSFSEGRIDVAINFLLASGHTGQTLETLRLSGEPATFERVVGVPLKSHVSLTWTYNFRRRTSVKSN